MTLWGVINEQVAAVFRQHAETIMSIVFSPDSALLLTASDDWTAKAVAIGSLRSRCWYRRNLRVWQPLGPSCRAGLDVGRTEP